jgi:hypothetical protein
MTTPIDSHPGWQKAISGPNMTIPTDNHPGWQKAISGQTKVVFEFLATKILMGRLHQEYKKDASPGNVKKLVAELRGFFLKNVKLPKAQRDLQKII